MAATVVDISRGERDAKRPTMGGAMNRTLSGWKEIASALERIWGITLHPDTVRRYAHLGLDPLPISVIQLPGARNYRIVIGASDLESWGRRMIRARD